MRVFEATVGGGTKVHAVVLDMLPPYKQRQDKVCTTVCKQRVRGSSVFATEFGRKDSPYENCARCTKGLGVVEQAAEEATVTLESRMEQLLTQLDRGHAQGFSAQEQVESYLKLNGGREHYVESVITIKGKRYRLRLREEG
jgi:hypothetical protein